MTIPKKRIRPIAAIKALRALLRDPEDTRQVFLVTDALNGDSGRRNFERFRRTETGEAVLRERRVLLDRLCDRDRLSKLPSGTLGRQYYEFMAREGLTADGLVEASRTKTNDPPSDDVRLFAERIRDWHDLQHVLTGYGRDGLGEVCVLTFFCAQGWNPGLLLIAIAGMFKVAKEVPGYPIKRAVFEAWRHGRAAAWLTGLDWEGLLGQQLDTIRPKLAVRTPVIYQRIMERHTAASAGAGALGVAAE
jgi:ubiquinone biosynthesis protein COQ4